MWGCLENEPLGVIWARVREDPTIIIIIVIIIIISSSSSSSSRSRSSSCSSSSIMSLRSKTWLYGNQSSSKINR